tara:strand:+ start:2796 stop:3365 length:570 start_codon:yes stop_codon:yes gene_type:complete
MIVNECGSTNSVERRYSNTNKDLFFSYFTKLTSNFDLHDYNHNLEEDAFIVKEDINIDEIIEILYYAEQKPFDIDFKKELDYYFKKMIERGILICRERFITNNKMLRFSKNHIIDRSLRTITVVLNHLNLDSLNGMDYIIYVCLVLAIKYYGYSIFTLKLQYSYMNDIFHFEKIIKLERFVLETTNYVP